MDRLGIRIILLSGQRARAVSVMYGWTAGPYWTEDAGSTGSHWWIHRHVRLGSHRGRETSRPGRPLRNRDGASSDCGLATEADRRPGAKYR